MNFYFFNVENGHEIRDVNSTANLTQYGPYVYRETRRKEDLTHGGADGLYYNTYYAYQFDQEKTNELDCFNGKSQTCSDQDTIKLLNPILAMLGPILPKLTTLICEALPEILPDFVDNWCNDTITDLEKKIIETINQELDPTKPIAPKDDLIFETTVNNILYQVNHLQLYTASWSI